MGSEVNHGHANPRRVATAYNHFFRLNLGLRALQQAYCSGCRGACVAVSSVPLFVLTLLAILVRFQSQDFSMMRLPPFLVFALLVAPPAFADQKQAISATVTGDDQQVGFRAMVMKQAIEYNLAGSAKNENNEIVRFTLQGDPDRLNLAIATIREGTKRSSNIEVSTIPAAVDPALKTFTVIDWTSSSRHITTPYTLVFNLRPNDEEISKSEAKAVWRQILQTTVKGDDLQKLGNDD